MATLLSGLRKIYRTRRDHGNTRHGLSTLALKMLPLPTMRSCWRLWLGPRKISIACHGLLNFLSRDRASRFVIWGGANAQRVTRNNMSYCTYKGLWRIVHKLEKSLSLGIRAINLIQPLVMDDTQVKYLGFSLLLAHTPRQHGHGRTTLHYNALIRLILWHVSFNGIEIARSAPRVNPSPCFWLGG